LLLFEPIWQLIIVETGLKPQYRLMTSLCDKSACNIYDMSFLKIHKFNLIQVQCRIIIERGDIWTVTLHDLCDNSNLFEKFWNFATKHSKEITLNQLSKS